MKKHKDLYEEEKRRHEETLKRYQEDHMDEMEIFNVHKRCNKTVPKAAAKTGAKAALKVPKGEYHAFLREKLDEMTGEDQRNYRSIVSRRWKEIKEDLQRLSAYNDKARQMKNEPTKLGDDAQHEKVVAKRSVVKRPKKAPKTSGFVDTDPDESVTEDEQEPVVKKPQKAPKTPEFVDTDSNDSDSKDESEPAVKLPQKVSKLPRFIDEEQRAKKASGSGDGKKTATKAGKKVKKILQPKNHQNHPN